MDLMRYLYTHFLTEDQLLEQSGITAAELHAWQQAGAMPQASYRLRIAVHCDSVFGPHAEEQAAAFYARGSVSWARMLKGGCADAFGVFCTEYRAALDRLPLRCTFPGGLEAHLASEWQAFLDGTYGLCTRTGLPAEIAAKEAAVAAIKELGDPPRDLEALRTAVDLLDRASSAFAPHERTRSSRHTYIDGMRRRFGLPSGS